MIPKQAIEKAIEGGWNGGGIYTAPHAMADGNPLRNSSLVRCSDCWCTDQSAHTHHDNKKHNSASIALDPTFWQALGKALGWLDVTATKKHVCPDCCEWMKHAQEFYDLILTGHDTEKFWNDLIPAPLIDDHARNDEEHRDRH